MVPRQTNIHACSSHLQLHYQHKLLVPVPCKRHLQCEDVCTQTVHAGAHLQCEDVCTQIVHAGAHLQCEDVCTQTVHAGAHLQCEDVCTQTAGRAGMYEAPSPSLNSVQLRIKSWFNTFCAMS